MEKIITQSLTKRVDKLLDAYRQEHRGDSPLYINLSPKEAEELTAEIRSSQNVAKDFVITSYRDSKIIQNLSIKDGELYVSNDLPETGS